MLKIEIPHFGVVPNRVAITTAIGLVISTAGLGFAIGNGTTTENSIAHIADAQGRCAQTVTVLKTQQGDTESLHHRGPTSLSKVGNF